MKKLIRRRVLAAIRAGAGCLSALVCLCLSGRTIRAERIEIEGYSGLRTAISPLPYVVEDPNALNSRFMYLRGLPPEYADYLWSLGGGSRPTPNRRIRVTGTRVSEREMEVEDIVGFTEFPPQVGQLSYALVPLGYSDSRPVSLRPQPETLQDSDLQQNLYEMFNEGPHSLAGVISRLSSNRLSMSGTVFAPARRSVPGHRCREGNEPGLVGQSGYRTQDFDGLLTFWPESPCDTGGAAASVGRGGAYFTRAWFVRPPRAGGTVAHEVIHTLGSEHANSLECVNSRGEAVPLSSSCTEREYGDTEDVMGLDYVSYLSPWRRLQLGWIDNEQILSVSQSGVYEIQSASDPRSRHMALRVQTNLRYPIQYNAVDRRDMNLFQRYDLWVDFRAPVGFDSPEFTYEGNVDKLAALHFIEKERYRGATIRLVPNRRPLTSSSASMGFSYLLKLPTTRPECSSNGFLEPGMSFTDPLSGVTITALERKPGRGAEPSSMRFGVCFPGTTCAFPDAIRLPEPVYTNQRCRRSPVQVLYPGGDFYTVASRQNALYAKIVTADLTRNYSQCRIIRGRLPRGIRLRSRDCYVSGNPQRPRTTGRIVMRALKSGSRRYERIEFNLVVRPIRHR